MALALFPVMRRAGVSWEERREFLARALPRFSRLAIVSVVLLAVTGTLSLVLHTADLGMILGSTYGQVLAVKVAAYGVLVAIGAINLRRLTPMLQAKLAPGETAELDTSSARPVRGLRRNVLMEIGVASVALLLAGGLTLLPPPTGAAGSAQQPAPTTPTTQRTPLPTPQPATSEAAVGGYSLLFSAQPSLEGDVMSIEARRADTAAPPLTDVARVLFRIIPQDIDGGSSSYTAERQGEESADLGKWGITEQVFTLDGAYLLTAIIQRTEAPDLRSAFRLTLAEDGSLTAQPDEIIEVGVLTDPSPPVTGTTTITLVVTDGEGAPVDDAKITVNPFMPAHAHVDPVTVAAPVPGEPGTYTTTVSFDMGGAWLFIFNVERPGRPPLKVDASLEVEGPDITPTPRP
jgi:uncharacterized membrane protein